MSDESYYEGDMDPGQEAGPPSQPAPDPYDQLGELGYSQEETAATREVLDGIIGQAVQPLQQDLQYVRAELAAQELQEDLTDLEEAYPELQRDDVAGKVLAMGREYAEQRGNPQLATDPEVLEYLYLKSRGARPQQQQRSSPGRPVGNALAFDANTPEAQDINAGILSRQGHRNVYDRDY